METLHKGHLKALGDAAETRCVDGMPTSEVTSQGSKFLREMEGYSLSHIS